MPGHKFGRKKNKNNAADRRSSASGVDFHPFRGRGSLTRWTIKGGHRNKIGCFFKFYQSCPIRLPDL